MSSKVDILSKAKVAEKRGRKAASKLIRSKGKAQASVEYLSVYGWALLIMAAVLAFVLIYVSLPQSIAPSRCTISLGFDCNAVVFGTNTTTNNITIAMAITNRLPQPMESPNLTITYNGVNYTGSCSPAYLPPGASSICEFKIPQKARLGEYVSSPIYITAKNCGLAVNSSCASAPKEVYAGNMQAHATTYVSPNVNLNLFANTTSPIQGHKVKITAYVTLLGYPVSGGVVNFTVNNPNFIMSPQSALTSSSGYAYSNLFGGSTGTVKVTGAYASVSKNLTFTFAPAPTTTTTTFGSSSTTLVSSSSTTLVSSSSTTLVSSSSTSTTTTTTTTTSTSTISTYTLTVVASPSGQGTVSGGGTYSAGSPATLTATNGPAGFTKWSCTGICPDGTTSTSNPWDVTVTGNATYTATFDYEIIATFVYTGTCPFKGIVSGGRAYPYGSTATLSVTQPQPSCGFKGWICSGVCPDGTSSTLNPWDVEVTGNATYTAQIP